MHRLPPAVRRSTARRNSKQYNLHAHRAVGMSHTCNHRGAGVKIRRVARGAAGGGAAGLHGVGCGGARRWGSGTAGVLGKRRRGLVTGWWHTPSRDLRETSKWFHGDSEASPKASPAPTHSNVCSSRSLYTTFNRPPEAFKTPPRASRQVIFTPTGQDSWF